MTLTADQILALAPDASSAKAGSQLASPSTWGGLGRSACAVWGACQGSGKVPYRTQIDLGEPAFKCSCPSRKFPCKHGIGLYLMLAAHAPLFAEEAPPAWVSDWLASRQQRGDKKRETAADKAASLTPEQAAAQAAAALKREDKREAKVARGLEELQTWLEDLAREGLSTLRGRGPAFWDAIAARMVDAQAGALASRLRRASGMCFQTTLPDWEARLARELAALYLLTRAGQRLDALPAALQADVRAQIGWSISQDELLEQAGVTDRWLVLAQHTSGDERIKARATWLRGAATGRWALALHYAAGSQGFDRLLATGTQFDGELVFYPGAAPLRALIKRQDEVAPITQLGAAPPCAAALAAYGEALAANPFLERSALALGGAVARFDGLARVQCNDGASLPLHPGFRHRWPLQALTGGHPATLFGEFDGHEFMPWSAWVDGRLHNFDSDTPA